MLPRRAPYESVSRVQARARAFGGIVSRPRRRPWDRLREVSPFTDFPSSDPELADDKIATSG